MTTLTRASIAVVLSWVRLYTWRMPRAVREARIAEIESDLWESSQDDNRSGPRPLQIIARLLIGIPDDLQWRAEQIAALSHGARLALALVVTVALMGAVWVRLTLDQVESPPAPSAPDLRWRPKNPLPPPPPPPPPF